MTNRSFLFSVRGSKYIMRIPGDGTNQLINRRNEAAVFNAISGLALCDDPAYINPENGYKITKFLDGAPSIYRDYGRTKENVFSLRSFIESLAKD